MAINFSQRSNQREPSIDEACHLQSRGGGDPRRADDLDGCFDVLRPGTLIESS